MNFEAMCGQQIPSFAGSPFAGGGAPWQLTAMAEDLIAALVDRTLPGYHTQGDALIHDSARIEPGAVIKGPAIIGPGCFLAAGSLLRGGCWLQAGCVIGPGTEVKSSFLFERARAAHFNFLGDSLVGADVNIEAGAVIANHRNELLDPAIRICHQGAVIETGVRKFGALVGDGCRIGANAVIAPGAILAPGTIVGRLQLVDQRPPTA